MTKASPIKTTFEGGEWSPLLGGRVELDGYSKSCVEITNMICLKQGAVTRRGGSRFISEVKNSAHNTILIPFEFNVDQAFHIELGNTYARFYQDNALVMSGMSPYEIVTPFAHTDLVDSNGLHKFQIVQSADVIYLTHPSFGVYAIARLGATNWTITKLTFNDGPYLAENVTTTTLGLSGTSGSVTVTASSIVGINNGTGFQTTDVGRVIRFHDGTNWTWLTITARASTTSVTATVSGATAGATTATVRWRLGAYSDTTGWPRVVAFFQDRLLLAGNTSYPDRWDLSRTAGYSSTTLSFAPSDADGTVTDDASIYGNLLSEKLNAIQWSGNNNRGLILGTSGREWLLSASTSGDVLTPSNAKVSQFSSIGSAYIQPAQIESGSLFVQRARRKLLDVIYSFDSDALKPRDLTIASEHITRTGIAQIQFQQEPINVLWARLTNGRLIGFTYYPDEKVFAWHGHEMGGEVKSLSVIPSTDGEREELMMIIERTIDGATVKYVEVMTRHYEDDIEQEDAFHVDCGITYDGAATATVTGLDHLEGETVKVMVDGKSHPDLEVSGGEVTLANSRTGSVINVGLGNTWRVGLQRLEAGAQDGVAQGKNKRITRFVIRLLNTLGLRYGAIGGALDEYSFNQGAVYGDATPLFSGDTESLLYPDGYDQAAQIQFEHDGVFPATLLAVMPQVVTEDRG